MTKPRKHDIVGMSSFLRALEPIPKTLVAEKRYVKTKQYRLM